MVLLPMTLSKFKVVIFLARESIFELTFFLFDDLFPEREFWT
jgi:hypothetical protein